MFKNPPIALFRWISNLTRSGTDFQRYDFIFRICSSYNEKSSRL